MHRVGDHHVWYGKVGHLHVSILKVTLSPGPLQVVHVAVHNERAPLLYYARCGHVSIEREGMGNGSLGNGASLSDLGVRSR